MPKKKKKKYMFCVYLLFSSFLCFMYHTGFSYRTQNRVHFDESEGVNHKTAERYVKTLTIPGSADLYRKTAAQFFGHTIAPQVLIIYSPSFVPLKVIK